MKINIHAGHNPDGKKACGAVGLIKESTEARRVTAKVIEYLKAEGHTVYDCTCDNGTSQADVLYKIVTKCNAHAVDIDVSIHFNSGRKDPEGDGSTGGVEVWVYSTPSTAATYADKICNAIADLGFKNRGVKVSKDLYFIRKTKSQALLVECCFVDDRDDIRLYNVTDMAKAIVQGITGKEAATQSTANTQPESQVPFKVKIKVDALYIRKGPGTNYSTVSAITDKGTYTIIKTNGSWGYLKSEIGWINIGSAYVDRV